MGTRSTERLTSEDAEILGLESTAIKGHKASVLVLDPAEDGAPLDIDELRTSIASRLSSEPRARQRVLQTPMGLGRPAWVDYAEFDLADHVLSASGSEEAGIDHAEQSSSAVSEENPGDDAPAKAGDGLAQLADHAALREYTARLMSAHLDHDKPMWTIHALRLSGGRTGLVLRIHHCIADGIGTLRFLGGLLWDEEQRPQRGAPEEWTPEPVPSAAALAGTGLADRAAAIAGGAVGIARSLTRPAAIRDSLGNLARLPRVLIRELRPGATEGTRFDRSIGPRREVAWLRRPIAELKGIGAAHSNGGHATINDVLLAGLAGGIRAWLGDGAAGEKMRVKIPVSMHRRDSDSDGIGNRDSFLFVDLPLEEADPVQRLRQINAETAKRKEHHDAEELYGFFQGISHLSPLHHVVSKASMSPREFTIEASNVPGPRSPRWVLGRRVTELYSVTEPAARHALRVSAISLEDQLAINLCTDPDALEGVARLADHIEAAFDELATPDSPSGGSESDLP